MPPFWKSILGLKGISSKPLQPLVVENTVSLSDKELTLETQTLCINYSNYYKNFNLDLFELRVMLTYASILNCSKSSKHCADPTFQRLQ